MPIQTYKRRRESYGTGGYIEGYITKTIPVTKIEGKSTSIKMTVDSHNITAKDVREAARYYPKDIKTIVCKMSNQEIIEEFL